MAYLRSINLGTPQERAWAEIGRTSIDKRPAAGAVEVGLLGLVGDQVSDVRYHGGPDQAVYAYAREDLDHWERELGREIRDGQFGENLTTEGLDLNEMEVGTRWQVGEVLLEVATVRTPCNDFKCWMGESGYDNTAWVRRFALAGRPGPYLRVLAPGSIVPGQDIQVVHVPGHGVSVRTMFRALTSDRSLLPELRRVPGLPEGVRRRVEGYGAPAAPLDPV